MTVTSDQKSHNAKTMADPGNKFPTILEENSSLWETLNLLDDSPKIQIKTMSQALPIGLPVKTLPCNKSFPSISNSIQKPVTQNCSNKNLNGLINFNTLQANSCNSSTKSYNEQTQKLPSNGALNYNGLQVKPASCNNIQPASSVASSVTSNTMITRKMRRSFSYVEKKNGTNNSGGLLGAFNRQLRMSLRGLRSELSDEPGELSEESSKREFAIFRYRQARFASRRVRKRVVFKHGDCNVVQWNVAKRRRRYLQDIFTTLVDAQWRWTLLVFALNFLLSWLGFAVVWWLIMYTHGDLSPQRQSNSTEAWVPCVSGINSFTSCFLFSVETQHTIGYGVRTTTEECPEAIFVMCLQSIVGVFIQAFMVGIVFAKLSRPKKRAQTLLFSRNSVICQRDGQLSLMFRVGDMRKSHIVEAHVRAQLIRRKVGLIFAKLARAKKRNTTLLFSRNAVVCLRDGQYCLLFRVADIRKSHILEAHVRAQVIHKKVTREGELLPFYQQELKVGADGEEDRLMFIWPMTIVHKINENSPLYNLSASDMLKERFEIVVMLEGVIESTGMTTQARSSYLPSEIFWGHRFEPIVSFRKETGEYEVDYTLFNNTYEVDTPLCSAKQLDELRANLDTTNRMDRILPLSLSNDTLELSSMDSVSLDEHIEIKIPESKIRENRAMLARSESEVQHSLVNERERNNNRHSPPLEGGSVLLPKNQSASNGILHHHHHHHHHHRKPSIKGSHSSIAETKSHHSLNGLGHEAECRLIVRSPSGTSIPSLQETCEEDASLQPESFKSPSIPILVTATDQPPQPVLSIVQ